MAKKRYPLSMRKILQRHLLTLLWTFTHPLTKSGKILSVII